MHDTTEQYIRLAQAAQIAPGRPSANCVWRWCRKGVLSRSGERIRLQHVRIGGKIFTTSAWIDDFGKRLAEADTEYFELDEQTIVALPGRPRTRSQKQRLAAIERAERELEEAGV